MNFIYIYIYIYTHIYAYILIYIYICIHPKRQPPCRFFSPRLQGALGKRFASPRNWALGARPGVSWRQLFDIKWMEFLVIYMQKNTHL